MELEFTTHSRVLTETSSESGEQSHTLESADGLVFKWRVMSAGPVMRSVPPQHEDFTTFHDGACTRCSGWGGAVGL